MLWSVDFKFRSLAVSINTESGDIIHIVINGGAQDEGFFYFNSRNSVKSQSMGKYSTINTINKEVLGHITTCLQSKVWGWALRWTGGVYIHISSKWGMGVLKRGPFDGKIRYIHIFHDVSAQTWSDNHISPYKITFIERKTPRHDRFQCD